jgi:hypothetical protein
MGRQLRRASLKEVTPELSFAGEKGLVRRVVLITAARGTARIEAHRAGSEGC